MKLPFLVALIFVFCGASQAFAQGYINAPIYASGIINVPGGTIVNTVIPSSANHPTDLTVVAQGNITTWNISLPSPPYDGQEIIVGCVAGAASSISVTAPAGIPVTPGGISSCTADQGGSNIYQYSAVANKWMLVFNPLSISLLPAFSGDCTTTAGTTVLTCTKTNGTAFTGLATATPGTNVLSAIEANLNSSGGLLGYSMIGTSGATIPLNNTSIIPTGGTYGLDFSDWFSGNWTNGVPVTAYALANGSDQSSELQALINSLATSGGTIKFGPGIQISIANTITLASGVNFDFAPGSGLTWIGAAHGIMVQTPSTSTWSNSYWYGIPTFIFGATPADIAFRMYMGENDHIDGLILSGNSDSGYGYQLIAYATGGTNSDGTRNIARNYFGPIYSPNNLSVAIQLAGTATGGASGGPTVVTDNTFGPVQASNILGTGFQFVSWADSNTFTGNDDIALVANNTYGANFNTSSASADLGTIYNEHFDHLSVDTFGTGMPNRYGAFFQNQSKGNVISQFLFGPQDAGNDVTADASVYSYFVRESEPNTNNNVTIYSKGVVDTGLRTFSGGISSILSTGASSPANKFTFSATDAYAAGSGVFAAPFTVQNIMASGGTGERVASYINEITGYGGASQFYVGQQINAVACGTQNTGQFCAGQGGGGGGYFSASNPYVLIYPGVASGTEAVGEEIDTDNRDTASHVDRRVGLQIVSVATDTEHSTSIDAGLWLGNQAGGVGYNNGIEFASGGVPSGGTLIKADGGTMLDGINFADATFTDAAIKVPNIIVSGQGSGNELIVSDTSNAAGANIELQGNGGTTPNKFLRAYLGHLQCLTSGYSGPICDLDDVGNFDVAGTLRSGGYTVSGLPAGSAGMRAYVTDQLSSCPALGGTFTGGGSVICPAFFNGTSWIEG